MSTTDPEAPAPRWSLWKRLLLLVGLLVLLCAIVSVTMSNWDLSRADREHQAILAQIDEEEPGGWRLEDLEAARPHVPPGKNSALVIARIARPPANWPPRDVLKGPVKRAINEALRPERLAALENALKMVEPTLLEARRLADFPHGRYDPTAATTQEPLKCVFIARLLSYDSEWLSGKGDIDAALRSVRASVNVGRSLDDEPFFVSQRCRVSCVEEGLKAAEAALALGQAGDAELAALQRLLAEEEKHPTYLVFMRGERAVRDQFMTSQLARKVPAFDALVPLGHAARGVGVPERWYGRWVNVSRAELRRQHTLFLRMGTRAVATARLPAHEQPAEEKALAAEFAALPRSKDQLQGLMQVANEVGGSCRLKQARVSSMRVLLAVERYRLANGRWPTRLEDIPTKLLDAVPLDPFDGKPLRYRRLPDGVVVYSVGPDGSDDGGNINPPKGFKGGRDIGFRLYDPDRRKQPPR